MQQTQGSPVDWTNGTGVFSGTTITIPANLYRKWLLVQNQDTTAVTVSVAASNASNGNAATPIIALAAAAATGGAGGILDRNLYNYVPVGQIVITGTNGSKVCILEGS